MRTIHAANLGPDVGANSQIFERVAFKCSRVCLGSQFEAGTLPEGRCERDSVYADRATLAVESDADEDEDGEDQESERAIEPTKMELFVDGVDDKDFAGEVSGLILFTEIHHDSKEEPIEISENV